MESIGIQSFFEFRQSLAQAVLHGAGRQVHGVGGFLQRQLLVIVQVHGFAQLRRQLINRRINGCG